MPSLELGQTTTDDSLIGLRDAFHSPCVLVECFISLKPGQRVTFASLGYDRVRVAGDPRKYHAIVDPFLEMDTRKEERFWVILRPGSVKNLTHNFAIGDESEDEAKRKNNIEEGDDPYEDAPEFDGSYNDGCENCES